MRDSFWLCVASSKSSRGALKKTCSASAMETPCFSFLRSLPSSQSNPAILFRSVIYVYYHDIQKISQAPLGTIALLTAFLPTPADLALREAGVKVTLV